MGIAANQIQAGAAGSNYFKTTARVATTANITLSGTQTIDGVSLSVDERVLVKNQTDETQNGIYLVKSGAWVRTEDADENAEVKSGLIVSVRAGSVNSTTLWQLQSADPITVGSTVLTFGKVGGGGTNNDADTLIAAQSFGPMRPGM